MLIIISINFPLMWILLIRIEAVSSCFNETIADVGIEQCMVGAASQNSKTFRRLKISDRLLYHFWICLSILHCMHFESTLNCKYLEIQLFSLHIIFIWTQNSNNLKTVKFELSSIKVSGELDSLSWFSRVRSVRVLSRLFCLTR